MCFKDCHSCNSLLFIVLFNILTGRNYHFDFTQNMQHFDIVFAVLCLHPVYIVVL